MNGLRNSRYSFWFGAVFGAALVSLAGALLGGAALARQKPAAQTKDNEELMRLYAEDQADRQPAEGKPIDWKVVAPRDRVREERAKQLYREGALHTGKDYENAAMVLQHASKPEDHLLAHELCVVAISKGNLGARWLAAASEDRFLMNINRPQRFGTQYRSTSPDQPLRLYQVDPTVTDALRREMSVPSLAQAKEKEAEIEALFRGKKP